MVWRCRRQRVQKFFLRCYKKEFGEKWSRTRYRSNTCIHVFSISIFLVTH